MALLLQGAGQDHLKADDLIRILKLLSSRLSDIRQQSTDDLYQLALAVSHLLDAMADTKVTYQPVERLDESLSTYLNWLKGSEDPYLVYQAAYAYQALLCVPENETTWQAAMRRPGEMTQGVAGFVSTAKGLDLRKFIEGLQHTQEGLAGVAKVDHVATEAYDNTSPLVRSGQEFMGCLQEGLSFKLKRDWYSALRGADVLIRNGELGKLWELVYQAPCRHDAAFQWGLCQRLGEIAANPMWDASARQSAIAFLGEIYRDDKAWGEQAIVKKCVLNILMQLATPSKSALELQVTVSESLLQDLEARGDGKKGNLYRSCQTNGPIEYPLKIVLPEFASPLELDRPQNRSNIEGNLHILRRRCTLEHGNAAYIPPQATSNLQTADGTRFPLMNKVKEFLKSDQKVFLLLGDSGSGKSTFSRQLELDLWRSYRSKTGRIPLHINLPTIDKPEFDMIAKQLKRDQFTDPQIREMKQHRTFILICDGYDESQQMHNLYMSNRLNQPGEWKAQMVISCRSEYMYQGLDYRDRFQPEDRNQRMDSPLFQEAVIAPFSIDQMHDYITQYVSLNQPRWRVEDYKQALDLVPSVKDMVKNPFMMALSLDVLPRMVDPGQRLSDARITRVALYDHFIEQWLERSMKHLAEKDMSLSTKEAFENLSADGFILNGIGYMKKFAAAIYKEQDGYPIVKYSQWADEGSWKDEFFRHKEKQLLCEACPLVRSANQYRFIHRSLLEYGVALAVFDPQDWGVDELPESALGRRGSTSSVLSTIEDAPVEDSMSVTQDPGLSSPLAWRLFVNEPSVLHFLEERVQQEPVFKIQLLEYIEKSKTDRKWRTAAANAITILVRARVQFNYADLRGIQIPKADLSYGIFDSAQLQGADLRHVSLRGAWLRQTNLLMARMTGVQFGELPFLKQDSKVELCEYSRDGKTIAAVSKSHKINVYSTMTWKSPSCV
ncbi:hypothetical protein BGX34_002845 [Mortierella sp. NVP85]|nr:hypothetical protein BGX34_002845 [Mortierella sp. NVP85]